LGCGDGRSWGQWLRDHTNGYIGVDVSESGIATAKGLGLDARLIEDAAALPFADASFDQAVSLEVLEHLFEPQLAVAEVRRVLRPRGRFIASVPNAAHWLRRKELALDGVFNPLGDDRDPEEPWRSPHIRFFTVSSLRRLLEHAGFHQVEVIGFQGAVRQASWVAALVRSDGPKRERLARRINARMCSILGRRLYALAICP
jgi:SAM-dependent methyltransferase